MICGSLTLVSRTSFPVTEEPVSINLHPLCGRTHPGPCCYGPHFPGPRSSDKPQLNPQPQPSTSTLNLNPQPSTLNPNPQPQPDSLATSTLAISKPLWDLHITQLPTSPFPCQSRNCGELLPPHLHRRSMNPNQDILRGHEGKG